MRSTHSNAAEAALRDIQHHIALAAQFIADIDFNQFRHDLRTVYAVIRCLEIISEASRRLPDDLKARHTDIPWKQIAGAGNVYRHDYEDVAAQIIWDTVTVALPPLEAAIAVEVARPT
ncbi:HepT-like ribonuclease domain-containing protein [Tardiphaga sp. 768_D3_N2_1]|uniref:HepT-like ribonuclease domain-containing protein n=1 Tax=Tardiphaga sp. 768_D3_N2_1 TaxID=3240783 RepID=UPI003F8C27F2